MEKVIGQNYTVEADSPLLKYLYTILPQQSRTGVKSLLSHGRIAVNGTVDTAFDRPLFAGDVVTVLPKDVSLAREIRETADEAVSRAGVRIVYEDDRLLVVDKPSGLLTVAAAGKGGKTLQAILDTYVKGTARARRKIDRLSGVPVQRGVARVWIIHRLDRGTSGLLVFAKDERTKDLMQSKWKDLVLERKYTAFLEGDVTPGKGAVQSWLTEHPKSLRMHSSPEEVPGGQLAISHYNTVSRVTREKSGKLLYTRTEFQLETGRKNQIRVHAADLGHPVAGDGRYGAQTDPIGRLALHASSLVFRHPYTGEILRFGSELPQPFQRLLK